jgi:uncharacterized protein HemX
MNRNQKIALGCGGAGCLGLIVVAIAALVLYFVFNAQSRRYSANSNYNFNINRNRNSNSTTNSNVTSNENDNSSATSASSISEDDKHKLYQAAAMSGDQDLIQRVSVKIGLMQEDYTPNPNYQSFLGEHVSWALRNRDFIVSLDTPDKARDYVNENLPD